MISLLPFGLFLSLFLGTGLVLTWQGVDFAFYQLPASIAIIPAILLAMFIGRDPLDKQINQFIIGAGHPNIITMCLIYLLAGAFATIAKSTGSVDASVSVGLAFFPEQFILPGLFLVAAFLSTAMGTSMGTIAAIAPIALGFTESAQMDAALVAGTIISGAIFGDNLSIISDTTIAATRSQGAHMKDKFRINFKFALPTAILCLIILTLLAKPISLTLTAGGEILGILPYIAILVLALLGMNVFVVLIIGILLAALIGIVTSNYQLGQWINDINKGFANMQDIIILSLFIGGLSELVKQQGGLAALTHGIEKLARKISPNNKKRAASIGIASLTFNCNFFTASNTVSIIVTGETAKQLAKEGHLTPAESASLLDIYACINQGLLPYGAQALLLGATLHISPLAVVSYAFYPMLLFFISTFAFWLLTQPNK